MITTIGYVAGSLSQASLKVSSAAGFLGPADKVRAGAARKVFSLKAFRAARLKTPAAAMLILAASTFEVFLRRKTGALALRRLDFTAQAKDNELAYCNILDQLGRVGPGEREGYGEPRDVTSLSLAPISSARGTLNDYKTPPYAHGGTHTLRPLFRS